MEHKESYMDMLLAAKTAWETYDDRKSLAPVLALVRLTGHPALDDQKITAEQLLGLLSRIYAKALILKTGANAERMRFSPYYTPMFKACNLSIDCENKKSVMRWFKRLLTDWPGEPSLSVYRKTAEAIFTDTVDRWYTRKSCDDYKEVAMTILDDAIQAYKVQSEAKIEGNGLRLRVKPPQRQYTAPSYTVNP